MGIIAWLIIGGLAGWIASSLMKTRQGLGMNILVGIVGAFVGGFLFNLAGSEGVTGFNIWSLFVAIIGAVVLLWLLQQMGARSRR